MTRVHPRPQQAPLQIDFLVIGAGIAGLACAIALRRVGHRVLVLEQDAGLEETSAGCRVSPNLAKILFHWGLEDKLRAVSISSEALLISLFDSGELLGAHVWQEEVLKETGGEFIFMRHCDLRRLLYDAALSFGAQIIHNSTVVDINPDSDSPSVTLQSGQVFQADVIVGADGSASIARQEVLDEDDCDREMGSPTGLISYNTIVPGKHIKGDPELQWFFKQKYTNQFVWFGDGHAVIGYPTGSSCDFAIHLYMRDNGTACTEEDSWHKLCSSDTVSDALATTRCERRLLKMIKLAQPFVYRQIKHSIDLEDWVHESGRLVVIGEAAHPLPAGAIQTCAMSVEDGAVLAKLFSHLRNHDQITSFLWAFQDLRQKRCATVHTAEMGNIFFMCMPPGEQQEMRDQGMRSRHAAGKNVLDTGDGGTSEEWEQIKEVFGYDAEDEADNWWVEWGILRERAKASASAMEFGLNIQSTTLSSTNASYRERFNFPTLTSTPIPTETPTRGTNGASRRLK